MGVIYQADDATLPAFSAPNANAVVRPFIATPATMLTASGAAGLLIGDAIQLAPIPPGAVLYDFEIRIPELDTGSAVTYDVGDNVVLSGATNGVTSGVQTVPAALGTSFTLTASASTAGFTSTNGFLMINGVMFGYGALSGSTFTTVYGGVPGMVIPSGSLIQQAGNMAAYTAIAAVQSGSAIVIKPAFSISSTTVATSTAKPGALPVAYKAPFNTYPNPAVGPNPAVPAQIGQRWFCLSIHASPTTYNPPAVPITGWIAYYLKGYIT